MLKQGAEKDELEIAPDSVSEKEMAIMGRDAAI
jgi:hypothetical protein